MAEIEAAIDGFLQHCAVERGLSPKTIEAYGRDLARFAAHLADGPGRRSRVDRDDVTGFLAALEADGLAARSRARMLVALRRLAKHLVATGCWPSDPTEGIVAPKIGRALPKVLRPDETAALLAAVDPDGPLGLRDRAMLELLYGGGLRVSELVSLPLAAVDRRAGLLRVTGKGRKERIVPIGEPALDAIAAYLADGRPQLQAAVARASDALFLSRRGSAMTRQNFFTRRGGRARAAG